MHDPAPLLYALRHGPVPEYDLRRRMGVKDDAEWNEVVRRLVLAGSVTLRHSPSGVALAPS